MTMPAMHATDRPARGGLKAWSALRWRLILAGLLAAIMFSLEAGTRILVDRISRIESRITREYAEPRHPRVIARPASGSDRHVEHGVCQFQHVLRLTERNPQSSSGQSHAGSADANATDDYRVRARSSR